MVAGKEQMIQSNSLQIDGGFSICRNDFFLLSSISRLDVTLSFQHDACRDPTNPTVGRLFYIHD